MPICKNCGEPLDDDEEYCSNCGHRVDHQDNSESETQEQDHAEDTEVIPQEPDDVEEEQVVAAESSVTAIKPGETSSSTNGNPDTGVNVDESEAGGASDQTVGVEGGSSSSGSEDTQTVQRVEDDTPAPPQPPKKPKRRGCLIAFIVTAIAFAVFLLGGGIWTMMTDDRYQPDSAVSLQAKEELQELVNEINEDENLGNPNLYTEDTYEPFANALRGAKDVLAGSGSHYYRYMDAIDELEAARNGLKTKAQAEQEQAEQEEKERQEQAEKERQEQEEKERQEQEEKERQEQAEQEEKERQEQEEKERQEQAEKERQEQEEKARQEQAEKERQEQEEKARQEQAEKERQEQEEKARQEQEQQEQTTKNEKITDLGAYQPVSMLDLVTWSQEDQGGTYVRIDDAVFKGFLDTPESYAGGGQFRADGIEFVVVYPSDIYSSSDFVIGKRYTLYGEYTGTENFVPFIAAYIILPSN